MLKNAFIVALTVGLVGFGNISNGYEDATKKIVVICFDDGYYSVYKYAYPILKRYQVPMTLAVITSYLSKSNQVRKYASEYQFMSQGEIKEMIEQLDIEVASHSVSHPDLTKLPHEKAISELRQSKAILDSLFKQETITFVYPYGAVNRKVIELTKRENYKLGRSVRWGQVNLWVDRYLLPVKEVRNTTTVDEVVRYINNNDITILLFHRLSRAPMVFTEWSVDKFNRLIDTLSANEKIEFLTLRDLYQKWWQEMMVRFIKDKGWLETDYLINDLFNKIDIDNTRTFNSSIIK
ncbi:MAG: polysaccharide deacetylase family protein [candidate division WOR-3 bacterium]